MLTVRQTGKVTRGPFSFAFDNVREIELVPVAEIRSRLVSGDLKASSFTTRIADLDGLVHISNSGRYTPNVWVPPLVGPALIEGETRKQFAEIRAEILRRAARRASSFERPMAAASAETPRMVTGLFRDRERAERAIATIASHGYAPNDINVVIDDDVRQRHLASRNAKDSALARTEADGVDLGGPAGGTLGTLFTAMTAVGTFLLVPGLVIAGPIAQALTAAGAAAVTGGLIGALHDWGIPKERVDRYEAALKDGGILLGVKARSEDDAELIEGEWKAIGAERLET